MTDGTPLGDRMKTYEAATRALLPRRTHTLLRVDGRAFHAYLRDAVRPFDAGFMDDMDCVAEALCAAISGSVFAYAQSDEISVLMQDYLNVNTQPWFGGVVQKMASISASIASTSLYVRRPNPTRIPLFDARVYSIPNPVEVANYFVWRQRDAQRNAVSMVARDHFSDKQLHGRNTADRINMLADKGVFMTDYPENARYGRIVLQEEREATIPAMQPDGTEEDIPFLRNVWVSRPAPLFFAAFGGFLATTIPAAPSFS